MAEEQTKSPENKAGQEEAPPVDTAGQGEAPPVDTAGQEEELSPEQEAEGLKYEEMRKAWTQTRMMLKPLEDEARSKGFDDVGQYVQALKMGQAVRSDSGLPSSSTPPPKEDMEALAYQLGMTPEATAQLLNIVEQRVSKDRVSKSEMNMLGQAVLEMAKNNHWQRFAEKNPQFADSFTKSRLDEVLQKVPQFIDDNSPNWYEDAKAYLIAKNKGDITQRIFRAGQREALKQQEEQKAAKTNTGGKLDTKEVELKDIFKDTIAPDRK